MTSSKDLKKYKNIRQQRQRFTLLEKLEEEIYFWLKDVRSKTIRVDNNSLKTQALKIKSCSTKNN